MSAKIISIPLDFPEIFIESLGEDLENEALANEAKTALTGTSDKFSAVFSSPESVYLVLAALRKLAAKTSSLTDYFHCHNLLNAIILGIKDQSIQIKILKEKLEAELKKRLQKLDISELQTLSEFTKSEQYLDPEAMQFMLEFSHFPNQQESWGIALNLLEKDELSASGSNQWAENVISELLSLKTEELKLPGSKKNYLSLLQHFLKTGANVDKEKLKTCFLNFIASLDLEKDETEQHALINIFDITVNKYFTTEFLLPSECVGILTRFPQLSLTPSIVQYALDIFGSGSIDEAYTTKLLALFCVKIDDGEEKIRIFGGKLGPILILRLAQEGHSDGFYNQIISVFKFGSGYFKIDLEATKNFRNFVTVNTGHRAFSAVGAICTTPQNFEDKASFQELINFVGNSVKVLSLNVELIPPICTAMIAVSKVGFNAPESLIQKIYNFGKENVNNLKADDKSSLTNLLVTILTQETADWKIWLTLVQEDELDEFGYLCEAILRNVALKFDDQMWDYFCHKAGPKKSIQIFAAMATIAAEGKFPRDKLVFVMGSQRSADRTLGLFRAFIKFEGNKDIEPEVKEVFKVCHRFKYNYTDAKLFEIHQAILERGEKGTFKIDPNYVDILAGYTRACVEYPPMVRGDTRSLRFGINFILKYDFDRGLVAGIWGPEARTMKEYLDGHISFGNKYLDENGQDNVVKARDKVEKYLKTLPF